ncbi:wobble nucleotide-excising tRNase [Aurantimicrobium minutum]|uniref:AAA family ATPase n=1 Tax=Aurantimicrobium minutum TaxID=708131 RepID=UPI002406FF75|nr:AAA family ATPase [Aurantimicrobium minutum]MDF9809184.1 wobble nucleotide-excising tRNase [Aurantimicrobium minutum]
MLDFLCLRGAPAFDKNIGVDIGPLAQVNFFFGANGSGKTTISRALSNYQCFEGTSLVWNSVNRVLGIKVYNRDYVDATLTPAGHLPGVFVLGEENAEIRGEIDSLSGPQGSLENAKQSITRFQSSLKQKLSDIDAIRSILREAAWAKRNEVPLPFKEMFNGYNNNKERLLDQVLEVSALNQTCVEDFESLLPEASVLLSEEAEPLLEIPLSPEIKMQDLPGYSLLGVAVIGSSDVSLASLIEKIGNSDWIREGRQHFEKAEGFCPFCQQAAPSDLNELLEAYFDRTYTEQMSQLANLSNEFTTWKQKLYLFLDSIPERPGVFDFKNSDSFTNAKNELVLVVDEILVQINNKITHPSSIVTLANPSLQLESINTLIATANLEIKRLNLLFNDRLAAKQSLFDRCWNVFVRMILVEELNRFEGALPGHLKGKDQIEAKISDLSLEISAGESRLRYLKSKVSSSGPTIERINRLLTSVGFHSFELASSPKIPDGYVLVRSNGDIATETLSEGERTFIAFLYFAQSLEGSPKDEFEPNDLLAVIDDPISSLDSDILYSVSTIIRRVMQDLAAGKGRVRQLVLLTHNAHFHNQVAYKMASGPQMGSWNFGIIRKRIGHSSEIVLSKDNTVRTAYVALWNEVKLSSEQPSNNAVGLQNMMRRILETYFNVLGGIDNQAIVAKFEGEDQIICRSLLSWVNAGSHSIFDDLDFTQTESSVESNLRVFRQIFKEQQQEGHYTMMMGEPNDAISAG